MLILGIVVFCVVMFLFEMSNIQSEREAQAKECGPHIWKERPSGGLICSECYKVVGEE